MGSFVLHVWMASCFYIISICLRRFHTLCKAKQYMSPSTTWSSTDLLAVVELSIFIWLNIYRLRTADKHEDIVWWEWLLTQTAELVFFSEVQCTVLMWEPVLFRTSVTSDRNCLTALWTQCSLVLARPLQRRNARCRTVWKCINSLQYTNTG